MRSIGNGLLLFWLFAGLMAAMLSSGGGSSSSSNDSDSQVADRDGQDSSSSDSDEPDESYSSDATVLTRAYDGHFYADIEINGQPVRMLIDTGASGVALTRDDARRAGVGISIGMPTVIGQGASGEVRGEVVTLDRVSLGSASAEEMPAVVLDTGAHSLLGQEFLSKFDSVQIKGDRMVLQ